MSLEQLPGELDTQQAGVTRVLTSLYTELWDAQQRAADTDAILGQIERAARVNVFEAASLASELQLLELMPGLRYPQLLTDTCEALARARGKIIRDRAEIVLAKATANMVSPYARLAAQILVTDAARAGCKAGGIYGEATHKQFIRIRQVHEPRSHSKYEGTIRPIDGTWLIAGIAVDGPGDERLPWSERAWCSHGVKYFRR